VGAGPARERRANARRQDAREAVKQATLKVSGILPASGAGLSRAGPAPTELTHKAFLAGLALHCALHGFNQGLP